MPGSNPVVSVTGFTLGGGVSWFARKYGWAAGHVTAFEVVDAAGDQARVTASSDADLFWALRGGGGDFAVVTAMEYNLHAEPLVFGGRMVWPADRAFEGVRRVHRRDRQRARGADYMGEPAQVPRLAAAGDD